MSKKTKRNIAFAVFFLIGLGITFYPMISSRWNAYRESLLVTEYQKQIDANAGSDTYKEMIESAQAYNKTLDVPSVPDAFSIRDGIKDEEYEALLNVSGTGMIGTVDIPAININIPIYHYTTTASLSKGAGHLLGSALPVGGESTHCVVSAHRGLPNQKFFSDLDKINIGDKFYMHILNKILAYEVYKIKVIEPTDVDELMIEDGEDLATLVTCEPYGVNTHRLLVMGKRVEFDEEKVDDKGLVTTEEHKLVIDPAVWVFAGFMLFILILVISTAMRKIISKFKSKKGGSA